MVHHGREQKRLIKNYEKLEPSVQRLVQLASIIPQSRTRLITLAAQVDHRKGAGAFANTKEALSCLDVAIKSGVLEYRSRSGIGPVRASFLLEDYVFRQAIASGYADKVKSGLEKQKSTWKSLPSFFYDQDTIIREMRFAFYKSDLQRWRTLVSRYAIRPCLLDPFCKETFDNLLPELAADFVRGSANQLVHYGDARRHDFVGYVPDLLDRLKSLFGDDVSVLTNLLAAQGNIEALKKLAEDVETRAEIEGCVAFLNGDLDLAQQLFDAADQQQRKRNKKRSTNLSLVPMLFYAILLLKENSASSLKNVRQICRTLGKLDEDSSLIGIPLEWAVEYQSNPVKANKKFFAEEMTPFSLLVCGWIWNWCFADTTPPYSLEICQKLGNSYRDSNLHWVAAEFSAIGARISKQKARSNKLESAAEKIHARSGTKSLVELIEPLPVWETALTALENLAQPVGDLAKTQSSNDSDERMIWEAKFGETSIFLTPYVQKRTPKGWSKGRKVALARLYDDWPGPDFGFLTDQDRVICKSIRQYSARNYYGYLEVKYEWDQKKLIEGLVGHNHIYLEGLRDEPVQVTEARPQLTIKRSGKNLRLEIEPAPGTDDEPIRVTQVGSHRYSVVRFSPEQSSIAKLIAGLPKVPNDQKDRVFRIAQSLASVIDVQSSLKGAPTTGEEVKASSKIIAQLTPFQDGLRAELFVQPFGEQGPFCRPGIGAQAMLANVDGKSLSTKRDLKAERKNLQDVLAACPTLDSRTVNNDQAEWLFPESEDALELVTELQTLADADQLIVLWPRGKTHDIAGSVDSSGFQVSVRRENDWFAASGKLNVDDKLAVDLMTMLDLVSSSSSRFVKMDDGRFLALSQELRQRIADIGAYGTAMKNKLRFAPVHALVVDELLDDTGVKADKHWKSQLSRIEEAGSVSVEVPSTLQADLRDYQREGFAWLKRLAHWSTGACLADDMGLGKTIQSLALLVDRAFDGPQLIVAPASVGFNWESETRRFAPTLTPKMFRDCDRDQFFEDIQPGDLAIVSYGLLQTEIERFKSIQWNTVLLDEAQAVKNMATKRSQAVMQLDAGFRLILTGTPMENHLGELWNLFRFIVPGLLGSQKDFRQRFAIPIERDQCRATRNRLKKLIQPFMLRRTKSEVLAELPARTESIIEVELSSAEASLYESLRLKALERVANAVEAESSAGETHLQMLAELTRLRLACCHPTLVGGKGIESAKLEVFREKIGELIENRHKVLVFSQFVKHLEILRKELDGMGVTYQYLDGATPVRKRKQAVEAFQAGQGDVFLISLKAGGTGLNLTAADYVIHMDPWWNPAVEDQATDRAHRIGQHRPVHVYRLITHGTIEEKIVELHNTKRDLADSVLEGSDVSGKLSTEELIGLLKDNQLVTASS